MVCLESAILQAPSLFTPNILNDSTNQFKRYVTIDEQSGFNNPLNWVEISNKLARNQSVTCTLVPLGRLDGNFTLTDGGGVEETKTGDVTTVTATSGSYPYTTEFRLAGKWVKILGYNPFQYSDVDTPGKYLS